MSWQPRPTRRRFVQAAGLTGLGLLAGCGRLPGQTPEPAKVLRIGFLAPFPRPQQDGLQQGLRELGYVVGENLIIDWRWQAGSATPLSALATELVELPVDLIVAAGSEGTEAAKQATSTIPIVSPTMQDPVGSGLIASLARPGGNVTGLSNLSIGITGKRLELLTELVPRATRVAVLWTPGASDLGWQEVQSGALVLGLQLQSLEIRAPEDVDAALDAVLREPPSALLLLGSNVVGSQSTRGARFAAAQQLPAVYETKEFVEAGGLFAYGPDLYDSWRRAATYVDKILKGDKPADLPVEQPTRFDFIINLKTAQALGLTIPQHVLLQATEVIQ